MRSFGTLVAIAWATLACRSSAPYTLPSAAINSGLAIGSSAQQRAAGGCYAVCTSGTTCNPSTGFCERGLPGMPGNEQAEREPLSIDELVSRPDDKLAPTVGVSPETGRAPPPPPGSTPPELK